MTLDPAMLMSLLNADPAERQAAVQRMLIERMGGKGSAFDLASAMAGAREADPAPDPPAPALRGLYREAAALTAELSRAEHLLGRVATALGACPRCLGTDEECGICAGDGAPGRDAPDGERFYELVAPAVRRLAEETGPTHHPMKEPVT